MEPSGARWFARFVQVMSGLRHDRIGLDFDLDAGSFFELDFVSMVVGQRVRNSNLSIKMIRALDDDLCFLGLARLWERLDDFFDLCWECSSSL